ncbi:hypothetical protein MSAN_02296100 [Mycena sanguinolenta]|uniref:Uncharacterized protein n=1 Tax=Mycena sanguinolenta TaxID=230812 RepID=A0A8H6X9G1_9AGAR|nr:hypothetical protein MSAN_02296100 [Mycena sanguinolenta]
MCTPDSTPASTRRHIRPGRRSRDIPSRSGCESCFAFADDWPSSKRAREEPQRGAFRTWQVPPVHSDHPPLIPPIRLLHLSISAIILADAKRSGVAFRHCAGLGLGEEQPGEREERAT